MSEIVKIYDSVIKIINEVKEVALLQETQTEEEQNFKEYYIRGLKTAIELIEQEQEFVYSDDYAYEKFDEILDSYLDDQTNQSTSLLPEDIEEMVNDKIKALYE
jgi:hypothetical protein